MRYLLVSWTKQCSQEVWAGLEKIFIQVFDIEWFENINLFELCVKMGGVYSSHLVGGVGAL